MCPLVNECKKRSQIRTLVCVTGQHRELLTRVLEMFGVVPDYDLAVMKDGQTLGGVTARILEKLNPVLMQEHPDLVLVHGDTTGGCVCDRQYGNRCDENDGQGRVPASGAYLGIRKPPDHPDGA